MQVEAQLDKKIFSVLFFSLFSAVLGMGAVVPLLPVYALGIGATGIYIGLIFGSFSLSRTILLPVFGRLSDKYGRKPFIVTGLLTYSLITIAFIFAKNVESIIVIRVLHGLSSAMIMPVVNAYAGDITPKGKEGSTMGIFNVSIFLGLSIGPIIGGVINANFGIKTAFISMALLIFIGFMLTYFLLPPTKDEKMVIPTEISEWKKIITEKEMVGLFIFRFAYISCIGIIWSFLPIFLNKYFSVSTSYIGLIVSLCVFISGIMQIPMGYVADIVNKKKMIILGGLVAGAAILLMERSGGLRDIIIASILFGIGGGLSTPGVMGLAVIKGNEKNAMGSVMSLLTMAHSLGMFAGAMGAGLIMDIFNLRYAFFFGTVIMLVGTAVFFILFDDQLKG